MIGIVLCRFLQRLHKMRRPRARAFSTRFSSSMIWRKCVERTMSVKLPPQVELIRLGSTETIVLHFIEPRPGHDATDLRLFAERHQVGHHAEMLAAPVAARSFPCRTALRQK